MVKLKNPLSLQKKYPKPPWKSSVKRSPRDDAGRGAKLPRRMGFGEFFPGFHQQKLGICEGK
jgi:hypothetical protein